MTMEPTNPSNVEIFNIIRDHSKLKDTLNDEEFNALFDHFNLVPFNEGDILLKEGAPADKISIIIEGTAKIVINNQQISKLMQGDIFGESAFSRDGTVKGEVIAKQNGIRAILTVQEYGYLIRENPHLARHLRYFFDAVINERKLHLERFFYKDTTQYIALIAHHNKKNAMINFVRDNKAFFEQYPLVATDATGTRLYEEVGITLTRKVTAGPLGGDQAIGAMVAGDNILAILFFRDPLSPHAHHADIEALGRLCDVYDVPFATNIATAKAILTEFTEHTPLPY